jgi:hypothetical protein
MPKAHTQPPKSHDDERPDAWQRFEKAVDAAVKHGPAHRVKPTASHAKNASPKSRKKA